MNREGEGYVYIKDIVKNVTDLLRPISGIKQSQEGEFITEAIPEVPIIQVYFEDLNLAGQGNTDRTTFGSRNNPPVRETTVQILVDLFTRQRSSIGHDMKSIHDYVDKVVMVFEKQNQRPFFNIDGIKSFRWSAQRVEFEYNKVRYVGVRYTLDVGIM